ncbi:carboxylesterase/lipase family protein [Williamsia phyllosphaerae]|uniref:carboxylesterase/lipase family protein n=1 Tax=Williamsia phyllosphaerae TaxID=885042 RepID=UPI00166BF8AA|nr:carboxylesterase/lipase family protein [Williamsia phyllosphaerae]
MSGSSTRVTIADGVVEGVSHAGLHSWRGIPYAAPPMGERRFRAPEPAVGWSGVRHCHSFRNAAPQNPRYTTIGIGKHQPVSEDCLTLNVVAPEERSGPLPVMVFIHGGAYILGSSLVYRGDSLVRAGGVVYVSINYRLGPLGYLDLSGFSSDTRTFDNNLGLRDQVAALEWVHRNIAAFGGDPDNVTIFGESAGGNAVTTLLATPAAEGLFSKAIAQSSAPALTVPNDWAQQFAKTYVEILRETHDDPIAALHSATPGELGRAGQSLTRRISDIAPGALPYGPSVDGSYLPLDPIEAARSGRTHPVPLIIGSNRVEANLFAKVFDVLPTSPKEIERLFVATDPEVKTRVTGAYDGYPSAEACREIAGDMIFWAPSVQIAQGHGAHAPTYMYRYDYATRILDWTGFGATHATELLAVFGAFDTRIGSALTLAGDRRGARRVTRQVQGDWLAFAHTSAPRPGWDRYTADNRTVRIIDDPIRTERDPSRDRRIAWEGFHGYSEVPLGGGVPGQE